MTAWTPAPTRPRRAAATPRGVKTAVTPASVTVRITAGRAPSRWSRSGEHPMRAHGSMRPAPYLSSRDDAMRIQRTIPLLSGLPE